MTADLDDLFQQGLRERRWDAVVEQLREAGGTGASDPAVETLEQVREEVRRLVSRLSSASSVTDVNRVGKKLNERIEMMKGLESAIAERPLAAASSS